MPQTFEGSVDDAVRPLHRLEELTGPARRDAVAGDLIWYHRFRASRAVESVLMRVLPGGKLEPVGKA